MDVPQPIPGRTSPRFYWNAVQDVCATLARHRELTWELTKREVSDRYLGQVLGVVWVVGHPLIQIGVYLFVFAFVFKVDVKNPSGLPMNYSVYLLSGLIPWLAFVEVMNKSASSLVSNANLVKQVVFPIAILPIKGVLASMLPQVISWTLLMIYCLTRFGMLPSTVALLPLLLILQVAMLTGLSLALAPLGAYFRDLKELVTVFGLLGVYLMPAFYLPSMVPALFRPLLYLNPLSYVVWCFQDVWFYGRIEHPWAWLVTTMLSGASLIFGYRIFRVLKSNLGNVL